MNWQTILGFVLAHPIFCIVLPALIGIQIALIFIAFRTCGCEQCGKPFGIWRCRDQVLELCYRCYKGRLSQRRKLATAMQTRETVTTPPPVRERLVSNS